MADFGALFKNGGNVSKAEKLGNYKVTYLHYSKLVRSPYQYREFTQEDIDFIVDLITAAGSVLQPVLVRKIDADEYEIIAGHQRCAGVRYLVEEMGLEKYALIPCMITNMDDVAAELNVVVSNVRKAQTPYETLHQINVLRNLIKKYPERFPDLPQKGTVAERVALRMGMSRSVVSEYIKISNNLGEKGMKLFAKNEIDKSAAMELAGFPEEEQEELIEKGILTYAEIKKYRKEKEEMKAKEIRELKKPVEEMIPEPVKDEPKELEKELRKPDKVVCEYLDAAARHLIKAYFDWMLEDFNHRVTDVTTSPEEMKKKLEGQSRFRYFATKAGVAHINLFDECVQIWDENSRCIGDYDWFYLAAAIQSQWNVVSLEKAKEKMQKETSQPQETCDVAKKRDVEWRKAAEAEKRQEEPTDRDIKAFFYWEGFKLTETITADGLKQKFRHAGGGGGRGLKDYQGSARGIRINYKKEITWVQAAKRLNEIREREREATEAEIAAESAPSNLNEFPVDKKPVLTDVDSRKVERSSMTDKEKMAVLMQKEQEFVAAFYESLYTGEKEIIKSRNAADITKMFKEEHGKTYDSGNNSQSGERLLWNCYPDKICFSISGLGVALQIVWGKFTTKLLRILGEQPGIEAGNPEDTDDDELLCDECANASCLTGNPDYCANCGPDGRNFVELLENLCDAAQTQESGVIDGECKECGENTADEPQFTAVFIMDILWDKERKLKQMEECNAQPDGKLPERMIQEHRAVVAGLRLLLERVRMEEKAEDE